MDKMLVFILGLVLGSFLNVCIYRLPKARSILFPVSHCPNCKRPICWYDNIPLLSYIVLGGKCRFCKAKISFRYFIVEALTASVLTLLFISFGISPKFFAYSLLSAGLIIATFVDFEINEIPDEISIGGVFVGLIVLFAFPGILGTSSRWGGLLASFLGALAGGGSIYLMGFFGELVFRKEAMGGGDVKLMAMIGSFLGWKMVLLTFFLAPLFGAAVGIVLKLKYGRETIPYGPYLSLAALVSIFFGEKILRLLLQIY